MDRRSIIFIVSLSFTLLAVNTFFEYMDSGRKKEYYEQQKVKKEELAKPEEKLEPKVEHFTPSTSAGEEKRYVIETPFQQLVFSNRGGALVELNLPFKSENNQSIVKEIGIDRDILENNPRDGRFPLKGYYTPKNVYHEKGQEGGYYPLIRRQLLPKGAPLQPMFYALNFVSDYPELSELIYEVTYFDEKKIVFEARQAQRKIVKTYSVSEEGEVVPYCLDLSVKIEGDNRGMWVTTGVPEAELLSGSIAPALKYRLTRQGKADVEVMKLPSDATTNTTTTPNWICNSNGFFGIIIDPLNPIEPGMRANFVPGTTVPSRITLVDQEYNLHPASSLPGYTMMLPLKSDSNTLHYRVFAGPFADSVLRKVDTIYTDSHTGKSPQYYLAQTYHGYFAFISRPFAKFLFFLMNLFHSISGSWALSIFFITFVLRIILYPLNSWSMKSMARMQQVAPEMEAIKKKYQKDPKRMQLEIASLYRDRGINPLSGCFPILIQMPFLLGMFDLLKSTFELRGATFIPGWIDNLAAPDVLFSWSKPIPLIGTEFHALPILLGLIMFLQQKMMSPATATALTDEQKQQKAMMSYMMPVMLTFFFYSVPSGLNIYWIASMLLGIPQQWWTNKKMQNVTLAKKKK